MGIDPMADECGEGVARRYSMLTDFCLELRAPGQHLCRDGSNFGEYNGWEVWNFSLASIV